MKSSTVTPIHIKRHRHKHFVVEIPKLIYDEGGCGNRVSPLSCLKWWVNFTRLLGGPLKAVDVDGITQFEVVKWSKVKFVGSHLALLVMNLLVNTGFNAFGIETLQLLERLKANGFTATDVVVIVGCSAPITVSAVLQVVVMRRAAGDVSTFNRDMAELSLLTEKDAKDHYRSTSLRSSLMVLGLLTSSLLSAHLVNTVLMEDHETSSLLTNVLTTLIWGIYLAANYIQPIVTVLVYLLLQQGLGMLQVVLRRCADRLEEACDSNEGVDAIHKIVTASLQLDVILGTVEKAFGKIIVVETVMGCVCGTIGYFFSTLIFTSFSGDSFNKLLFIGGLDFLIVGVISSTRLTHLLQRGQGISEQVTRMKRIYRKLLLSRKTSPEDSESVKYLLDSWSTKNAPVRPCDIFDLNYTTGLAVSGALLTYTIVLLDFKRQGA